jgi:class 3 adenylate cyclase
VRIGIETGEAIMDLAGAETERQQTSVGACVNLAARPQHLQSPRKSFSVRRVTNSPQSWRPSARREVERR